MPRKTNAKISAKTVAKTRVKSVTKTGVNAGASSMVKSRVTPSAAETERPAVPRRQRASQPTATEQLVPRHWYWVRRKDGSLAPYVFHRQSTDPKTGRLVGEFFVGSFIVTFGLNQVVGEAHMPRAQQPDAK